MAGDVAAAVDCNNNTAQVSWSSAQGAKSYMVTAVGAAGHRVLCETEEEWCDLTELQCGQTYSVSLATISDNCHTETHTNVTFSTCKFCRTVGVELIRSQIAKLSFHISYLTKYFPGPCEPLRVGVDFRCGTSTASMYWEEVEGVELYIATATCSRGMSLQCNSTNSTCEFSDLRCGETYVLSVTAYSNMCYSEVSNSVEVQTGKGCEDIHI